jgi:hypothetical protein
MLGGVVSAFVKVRSKDREVFQRGVITSSGLVAGDACMGVIFALVSVAGWQITRDRPFLPDIVSLIIFILLALGLGWFTLKPPRFLVKRK